MQCPLVSSSLLPLNSHPIFNPIFGYSFGDTVLDMHVTQYGRNEIVNIVQISFSNAFVDERKNRYLYSNSTKVCF